VELEKVDGCFNWLPRLESTNPTKTDRDVLIVVLQELGKRLGT
jgi:hypothetical protein